jgi:addiction module HigA family antidote
MQTTSRSSITTDEPQPTESEDRLPNPHVGDFLRQDFMIPLGMSAYTLARGLRISQTAVSEILSGKRRITANTALRLSRFLGMTPEFYLRYQASCDLAEAQEQLASVLAEITPYPRPDLGEGAEAEQARAEIDARLAAWEATLEPEGTAR